jgi:hypothetical protein
MIKLFWLNKTVTFEGLSTELAFEMVFKMQVKNGA